MKKVLLHQVVFYIQEGLLYPLCEADRIIQMGFCEIMDFIWAGFNFQLSL